MCPAMCDALQPLTAVVLGQQYLWHLVVANSPAVLAGQQGCWSLWVALHLAVQQVVVAGEQAAGWAWLWSLAGCSSPSQACLPSGLGGHVLVKPFAGCCSLDLGVLLVSAGKDGAESC